MTLQEIKDAISAGKKVHWANKGYEVVYNRNTDEYIIWCTSNDSCIGLVWGDGVTMNGKESEFFIA